MQTNLPLMLSIRPSRVLKSAFYIAGYSTITLRDIEIPKLVIQPPVIYKGCCPYCWGIRTKIGDRPVKCRRCGRGVE